jgi:hypothetical protein
MRYFGDRDISYCLLLCLAIVLPLYEAPKNILLVFFIANVLLGKVTERLAGYWLYTAPFVFLFASGVSAGAGTGGSMSITFGQISLYPMPGIAVFF